ncbi:DUF1772 domain-containing protein [Conexibacter arvalis]|uniref:Putative membrane protein n=1 Tax=Conexibacter arvalis TaxID=912552 RepID=A0A840ID54_9ACTN|nr:anthrone oxygenase family protein [Conexibacter arvalis]MBB4662789.1 putative membrane protein [Conexibacter arvalis]
MSAPLQAATVATALACGLVAGVFFAFSTFVMRALERQPGTQGMAAMQEINRTVINPWFMVAFAGGAVACVALAVVAVMRWGEAGSPWLLAGGVVYAVGCFGVTVAANVPLNDRLERVAPGAADAAGRWSAYVTEWTAWNHLRTVAALAAAALLCVALLAGD